MKNTIYYFMKICFKGAQWTFLLFSQSFSIKVISTVTGDCFFRFRNNMCVDAGNIYSSRPTTRRKQSLLLEAVPHTTSEVVFRTSLSVLNKYN